MRHSSRQHAQLQTKEIAPSFIHKSWYKAYISESGGLEDAPKESKFRFWHDEKRFKGNGETSLAQRSLLLYGGRRMGGNVKSDHASGPMGWQRKEDWDVLWSPASTAHKAYEGTGLRPGQLCSSIPGTQSICKKKKLSETLKQAYGEDAFRIIPRTYTLPSQVKDWRERMRACRDHQEGQMWMLKTAQHLGKGLKLVPSHKAVKEMLVQYEKAEAAKKIGKEKQVRPYVVAQQYIEDPLLINGLKFGIRVWTVITSVDPLRVYLHSGGLVLFSGDSYDGDTIVGEDGAVAGSHVTNYAQNKDGEVWNLEGLRIHLGAERYDTLMRRLRENTAMTFAAALAPMRREAQRLGLPLLSPSGRPLSSGFELMGLDFLVDASLHPWLLEVNSTPSLAVDHSDPLVEQMIYEEKNGMVRDMFSLMRIPQRFSPGGEESSSVEPSRGPLEDSLQELESRTGFSPLMTLFPSGSDVDERGWSVPWSALDIDLREKLRF